MTAHVGAGIPCVSHIQHVWELQNLIQFLFISWHPWLICLELEEHTEVIPLCEGGGWTRTVPADNTIMYNNSHSGSNERRQEECWCSLRNLLFLRHVSFRCVISTLGKLSYRKWCVGWKKSARSTRSEYTS
jgi:hypothetical protein